MESIATTLRGRHLLVTGATGFLGKVWLSHLLRYAPDIGRVTLIVRGTRKASALQRAAELLDTSPAFRPLKDHLGEDWADFLDARVDVVDGDVTRPRCGLDEATITRLASSVDLTIHIAGLTDFQPDPRLGVPANLDGAAHVADLVAGFTHRRLQHVSTCFVAGLAEGRVPERLEPGRSPLGHRVDVAEERAALAPILSMQGSADDRIEAAMVRARRLGWPNLYTYSKGLAELLLLERPSLDVTIVRPSVIECARSWPFVGWNEGLNTSAPIMWFCGTPFLHLPARGAHRFDIVPVDAVARWMTVVAALQLRGEAKRVYQLGTSDHNPATFERIVELTALGKRRHAQRPGARPLQRAISRLDVRPGHPAPGVPLSLDAADRLLRFARRLVDPSDDAPALARIVRTAAGDRLRRTRRELVKQQRALSQVRRMLDLYQPFIWDHDWEFRTDHIRAATAALLPEDAPFHDDLSRMDWRHYWMQVQYPGVVRWCFPILDGVAVPEDPPSDPPLALTGRARLQGAA